MIFIASRKLTVMLVGEKGPTLPIPRQLDDIDDGWILALVARVVNVDDVTDCDDRDLLDGLTIKALRYIDDLPSFMSVKFFCHCPTYGMNL